MVIFPKVTIIAQGLGALPIDSYGCLFETSFEQKNLTFGSSLPLTTSWLRT